MTERPAGPMLSNPRSDRVRAIRALTGRSVRQRKNRFLIEGPQAVREAVRAGVTEEILISPAAAERYPEITVLARQRAAWLRPATAEVVAAISTDAQGVVATAPIPAQNLTELLAKNPRLLVVLHENQDPGNAGTIIRTADAAGAQAAIMTRGSVDVFNPKVVRATAGSLFHLPVITDVDLASSIAKITDAGPQVLAATGTGGHDLDDLQDEIVRGPAQPSLRTATAWLFGNEARGLDAHALELADATVRIPIHGAAQSLNLATAAALCLYASARIQRREQPAKRGA